MKRISLEWRCSNRRGSLALTTVLLLLAALLCGCGAPAQQLPQPSAADSAEPQAQIAEEPERTIAPETDGSEEENMDRKLTLAINGEELSVAWEDNASVEALKELAVSEPLKVQMSKYGGFEQVGPLGASLPRDDVQTTAESGDIMLYSGNQIVVFYGANSWAYTRLGHITDKTPQELAELLGSGDVTITITLVR